MPLELSESTMAKLRAFAEMGRTATPLHIEDERRFTEFVFAAYEEDPELASNEIRVWCRDNGWNAERADAMANWVQGSYMVLDAQNGRLL
jgi:hypothetical protein